jgi:hypothetical protein
VKWESKFAQPGSFEDRVTGQAVLTNIAAGAGLAKTWLAEPEDANRATSLTMAEPVRRRVGGVQQLWLDINTELVRFAVDRAVAAGQLEAQVAIKDKTGAEQLVPAADTVTVTGPEIAASDANVAAEILVKLSQSLKDLDLSEEARRLASQKGWEDFMGIPYSRELDDKGEDAKDDIASEIEGQGLNTRRGPLHRIVG